MPELLKKKLKEIEITCAHYSLRTLNRMDMTFLVRMSKNSTGIVKSDSHPVSYLRPVTFDEIFMLSELCHHALDGGEMCGVRLLLL